MMPRKKRRTIIIISIVLIMIIIIGILIYLYMTTDAFKSNSVLFTKYISQNFSVIEEFNKQQVTSEMEELLQTNKYTTTIQGKVEYITNKELEGERKDYPINQIELKSEGQTDKTQSYEYKDIKLIKEEENLVRAEYLITDTKHSIRLDGIKQFVSIDAENTENSNEEEMQWIKLIEKMKQVEGYELRNILSKEEQTQLMNKYINIIMNNINPNAFTKKSNSIITINESSINTNAYGVTLTKEEFNDIYIKILEEAKEDEIILTKLEQLNKEIIFLSDNMQDIRQSYKNIITNKIEEIKSTNIGQEPRTITVYERNGQTIRTEINTDEYQLNIDKLTNQNEAWIELYYQEKTEKENSWKIAVMITNTENETNKYLTIERVKEGVENTVELSDLKKVENTALQTQLEAKAYTQENEVFITLNQTNTIVNSFKNKIELKEENNIDLFTLNEEQKANIANRLKENIQNQTTKLQENVTKEDIENMLVKVNILKESVPQLTDDGKITETEKNRFNAMFEFYQGNEIEKENVKKMIEVVKNNLKEIKIMQYRQKGTGNAKTQEPKTYLIVIEKDKANEDLANLLLMNLDNVKDTEKYNVKIEYNETTELVENIILSIDDK